MVADAGHDESKGPGVVLGGIRYGVAEFRDAILRAERPILGRAFSLLESSREDHRAFAAALLDELRPHAGKSMRIGVSGLPGAGKSTLIDALGTRLLAAGHRVAVLTVDPSSTISGGSILGDKTRMESLARDSRAFVRPSAAGTALGGVARSTRDSITICEAAGFDVVFIETVGVGQSESHVARMSDFLVLLTFAGGGDDLQAMKRGVLELADAVIVNKADGDNRERSEAARADLASALHYFHSERSAATPALLCSALTGEGLDYIWAHIEQALGPAPPTAAIVQKRRAQAVAWLHETLREEVVRRFYNSSSVLAQIAKVERAVTNGELSPFAAAEHLLQAGVKQEHKDQSP